MCQIRDHHSVLQVLLVAGGGKFQENYQRTTELFHLGQSNQWQQVAATPRKTFVLSGLTIDNTIFMTAKTQDPYGGYWDTWSRAVVIVKYDQQNDTWHNVYQMKNSREEPTAAAVPLSHGFLEYCQFEEN